MDTLDNTTSDSGPIDYVSTHHGDLLVEFAKTGLTKRFVRIHTGRGLDDQFRTDQHVTTAAFLEMDGTDRYNLIVEIHRSAYRHGYQLHRCVADTFIGEEGAIEALNQVKRALGVGASNTDVVGEVQQPDLRATRVDRLLTTALVALGVAVAFGALGVGLGGWALFLNR